MKIQPGNEISRPAIHRMTASGKKKGDASFTAFFEESVRQSSKPKGAPEIAPPACGDISEVSVTSASNEIKSDEINTAEEKNRVIRQIEKSMAVCDEYRMKLADPRVSLREISPLAAQLSDIQKRLAPAINALPENDALREILNRTLVMFTVESIKFNRGDYVG